MYLSTGTQTEVSAPSPAMGETTFAGAFLMRATAVK